MLNHRGHDKIMSRHCGLDPQSPALSASSRLRGHDGIIAEVFRLRERQVSACSASSSRSLREKAPSRGARQETIREAVKWIASGFAFAMTARPSGFAFAMTGRPSGFAFAMTAPLQGDSRFRGGLAGNNQGSRKLDRFRLRLRDDGTTFRLRLRDDGTTFRLRLRDDGTVAGDSPSPFFILHFTFYILHSPTVN
ncbi:MAG: hypothetical protein LBR51_06630 [Bacteroidales bacterium]|jgi:hypothetical protein|nr:hypothetical protein [Bacteroidales bacterium]